MENKVKWGILGTANIARWGMIPGMKNAGNTDLVAIAGRNPEKTESYARNFGIRKTYLSYDELLSDSEITAVYVPLPNDLHFPWVIKALKAGKHVLCEKPLALNSDEVKEMFKTAEECGVYLMEAYAYLHSPYVESLKNDIKSGIIGDIDYIDTAFVTQGYKNDFRLRKEPGGGAMYDLGCYCTTMILSLIDSKVSSSGAVSEFSDQGVDLLTSGIIGFENGARASFNVGMILGEDTNSRYDRLFIHGTKGSIRSDVEYNMEGPVSYKIYTDAGVTERVIEVPNNYSLEIEQFNRCILGNETPHITSAFSIKNAELIDTLLKKAGY
ncbi:MAG: Gfo/Idh/MocA family oxidoreductase [Clostridiales bacterium]|nr:Gfo/Idh/MocA family oxidoreductase [Clostridiales bacterium]